ncbi:MAG: flavodoxin family protein [Planctomycetaceae bacterium]
MAKPNLLKILVLYDSQTGNVEEMARLVADGAREIAGVEVRLRKVEGAGELRAGAGDVLWADGVAVGSPTNTGVLSWRMKRFWDEEMGPHWMKLDGRIGCAFSSAGGWGGGMELACQSVLTVLVNFGFLVFGVTDYVSRDLTLHYGAVSAKAPADDHARAACRCLGKRLAEWTATLVHGVAGEHPGGKLAERRPPHA